jgi:hypothetical protein
MGKDRRSMRGWDGKRRGDRERKRNLKFMEEQYEFQQERRREIRQREENIFEH